MNTERNNFGFHPKETAKEVFNSLKDLSVTDMGRYRESTRFLRRAAKDKQDILYYRSLEARINLRLRELQLLAFGEAESGEGLHGAAKLCRQTKGMSFEKEALAKLEEELDKKFAVEVGRIGKRIEQKVEKHGFNFGKIRQAAAVALSPLIIFAGVHLAGILNEKYDSEFQTISQPALAVEIDNKSEKEQIIYQAPEAQVKVKDEELIARLDIPEGSLVEIDGKAVGENSLTVEAKLMSHFNKDFFSLGIGGDNHLRILALHNGDIYDGSSYRSLPGKYLEKYGTDLGSSMFLKVNNEEVKELVVIDKFEIKDEELFSDPEKILHAAREEGVDVRQGDVAFITCNNFDTQTGSFNSRLIIICRLTSNLVNL